MNINEPTGIIELGNLSIKCLIFKTNIDNRIEILSSSIIKTEGFHNDTVVNLQKASNTIRACISEAEKKATPPSTLTPEFPHNQ